MSPDEKYKQLIEEARKLARPEVERNIFSICGRGHYENPISDLLAFFIDPNEEHRFGDLFLTSLFEAAGVKPPTGACRTPPSREECTNQGNRLDLVVEGDDWLLAIENKIRHQVINPLDDYVEHAVGRTPNLNEDSRHFVILCAREQKPTPQGWHTVTWRSYVDRIKQNFASRLTEPRNIKWQVIMREFLLNIEQECGDERMNTKRIQFIRENFQATCELEEMRGEYVRHMKERGCDALRNASCSNPYTQEHSWGADGIALRFLSTDLGPKTNIALVLRRDGMLRIQFYVYGVEEAKVPKLKEAIDFNKYPAHPWIESRTIQCFGFYDRANREQEEDEIFSEITDLAHRLRRFNNPPQSG